MQKYRIYDTALDDPKVVFRTTLADAKAEVKKQPVDARHDMRVELVQVPTDGRSIEKYLNGEQPADLYTYKRWRGTARGGLVELNADGTDAKEEA